MKNDVGLSHLINTAPKRNNKNIIKFWCINIIFILFVITFIIAGWNKNSNTLIYTGITLFCIDILTIILGNIYLHQEVEKKFIIALARHLKFKYFEQDVVFGHKSVFFNLRCELFKYTNDGARNVVWGKCLEHNIKFYNYSMGIDRPSNKGGMATYFHFFVLEIQIDHSIPNIICLPKKSFSWPRKYKENGFDNFLRKYYFFYPAPTKLDSNQKEAIQKTCCFILSKSKKIGIEFSNKRIIIFQYGHKINTDKIKLFVSISEFVIGKHSQILEKAPNFVDREVPNNT